MLFYQLLKYESLHYYVDFSHWAQVIHNICVTGKPLSESVELLVPGSRNYLSVHFTPYIYLIAVPFKLWPYAETIIWTNVILMMSSVIPMYKLSLACNNDKRFGLFMVSLLLFYPTFQYIVLYEFEMLRFGIPIILWMLYFWQTRKLKPYYLFVLLAVFVREEVGLTVFMFGIYLLLIEKERKAGLITALIGASAFGVITQIIMPSLRGGTYQHIAMGSFALLGNSIGDMIKNIIVDPVFVLKTVFQPDMKLVIKLANVFMLFLPLLFVPFLSPTVLLPVLGNLGIGLLSKSNTHVSYMLYYVSPSIPFIFYAFIRGWPKLVSFLEGVSKRKGRVIKGRNIESAAMAMVLTGLLVTNVFFGPSPISLQFWSKDLRPAPFNTQNYHYSVYKITEHHRAVDEFINLIPDSAVVSAPQFLHPRLFRKQGTIIFPRERYGNLDRNAKADYALFDKTNNGLKRESPAYLNQNDFNLVEKDTENWKLVKSEDGYFLYKRIRNPME